MKTVILYASYHHGNTKKLISAMSEVCEFDLIDILNVKDYDLDKYDLIGFASGIYYQKMHKKILQIIKDYKFNENQKVFLIATAGLPFKFYFKSAKKILIKKNVLVLPCLLTKGFDTYKFLGKIGGIANGRPNSKDFSKAKEYILNLINGN